MVISKYTIIVIILFSVSLNAQTDSLKTKEYLLGMEALAKKDTSKALDYRNNISILPNPTKYFNNKLPLYLYYEVYNLAKGQNNLTDFEQRITIQKKEEGGIFSSFLDAIGIDKSGNKVSLSSNYQTQEKDPQMYLQLDMNSYEPGDYIINVSAKDKISGAETSSSAELIQQ
jgi:hypothetical protein